MTETKKLDWAEFKYRSTVFDNNTRDTMKTISFTSIKVTDGIESIIISNLNIRHNILTPS